MKYKAHDYQQYATDFIIGHPVSCLILDMGLGKTVITLTALWLLLFDYFEVRRILVIAPKRVAETTWPAEIKKWEHLYGMTFAVAMGTAEQRKEALLSGADVTIIGRDNVSWMTKNIFFDFDMVIIDELSSFKSPKAQRFKDLKKVRPMAKRSCFCHVESKFRNMRFKAGCLSVINFSFLSSGESVDALAFTCL